jgi:hypothetical protein
VEAEWWTTRGFNSNIQPIGTEGLSRNYFQQCGLDGCNELETLYFLSGYAPWRIGTAGLTLTVDALEELYTMISSDLANPSSERSVTVTTILNPTDSTWRDGKIANEPWQWFNRNTSVARPNIGTDPCTEVLLRVLNAPDPFEMYTAAQSDNISGGIC